MKYWKGKAGTAKEGHFGTVDDTGYVPDSTQATEAEYEAWLAAQPAPAPKTVSDTERLVVYAKKQGWI